VKLFWFALADGLGHYLCESLIVPEKFLEDTGDFNKMSFLLSHLELCSRTCYCLVAIV